MPNMKSAALAYADRGWPIFPVRFDKTPYTKHGVLDATTNEDKIDEWWGTWPKANIGLDVAGAGMMVLDLDPGHSWEELEENIGPIPDTRLLAQTPRGGEHLFFSIGADEIVSPSASKIATSVDVRSFNSYVLLAPSATKDGAYLWQGSSEDKPSYRTDEMVRVANIGRKEKHEDRDEWIIEPDLNENVASAVKWLQTDAKVSIKGQGGDAMAYATAAHLKSFGISEALAFDLLWEHWCPRCVPANEWRPERLETKITNAYNYNTSPPGNITPAYSVARAQALFKPVEISTDNGNEWRSGRFRVINRGKMNDIKPPSWLIEDMLPQGAYVLMYGAQSTCKTFIALDMALSIANDFNQSPKNLWPESSIIEPGKVLFAAGEGRASLKKRVEAWETVHCDGEEMNDFLLLDPVPMINEELDPFLEAALAASPEGYKLVVLDTVGRAMQGTNENSQEHASAFTHMVEVIQRELGATVLALHHIGKNDTTSARGSSVFSADADTMVRLDRKDKDLFVRMTMTKQKDAPEWDNPKYIQLEEIMVGDASTLVTVKPPEREVAKDLFKAVEREENAATVLDIVEAVLMGVLSDNKVKDHSQASMAEAIACDERVEMGSQRLRKEHLMLIREDNSRKASRCYSPDTKKWRYQS